METLINLIGSETDIEAVGRELYGFASGIKAPVTGGMLVTCADESERECIDAFQHNIADPLLPDLKFGERSYFRIANLGGRYEWGAVHIADDHFSTTAARRDFKLLLVKINAHVALDATSAGTTFGTMRRYDEDSVYCGALHATMAGDPRPFAADLGEALCSEGHDRIASLLDESKVPADQRSLFAALASARLQARRALVDIQDRRPQTPTLFVVLPCVTLNRQFKDAEILCGVYMADWRSAEPRIDYQGLGDDPARYRVSRELGRLVVRDHESTLRRDARDHRQLALERWSGTGTVEDSEVAAPAIDAEAQAALDKLLRDVDSKKHFDLAAAKQMLLALVRTIALFDPVSAAVLLFSESVAGIHHLHRVQHIARNVADHQGARRLLAQFENELMTLPAERARDVIDILANHHRGRG